MAGTSHLKSLQALAMAIREGSLTAAAERLGITPAAVGQRIRALEDYLGTDLLLRGRSGLTPTPELDRALPDLRLAFDALDRVTGTLDFQRVSEIHIAADQDWSELWLLPRMSDFSGRHPNILFCINGAGDVPFRIGTPDLRIEYGQEHGEALYTDIIVPVTGPDNMRRITGSDAGQQMEGMPLLHLNSHYEGSNRPGWVEWFEMHGHRKIGPDRGVRYPNTRLALEAVRQNVGFLVCGMSLLLPDLESGAVELPFPATENLVAPHPYRLRTRADSVSRPQIQRFIEWLREGANDTRRKIDKLVE